MPPDLLAELQAQRWFGSKHRQPRGLRIADSAPLTDVADPIILQILEVDFSPDGGPEAERYVVVRNSDDAALDVLDRGSAALALLDHMRARRTLITERGRVLRCTATRAMTQASTPAEIPEPLGAEQTNSSVRFGTALVLKMYRRLDAGTNPELEVGRFLADRTTFRQTATLAGAIEYLDPGGLPAAVAVLSAFVPNRGDAWQEVTHQLSRLLSAPGPSEAAFTEAVASVRKVGRVTAELHAALSAVSDDPAFAPDEVTAEDVLAWQRAAEHQAEQALLAAADDLQDPSAALGTVRERIAGFVELVGTRKIRQHGDYHLGQVLVGEDGGLAVIDFEGEPAASLDLRREKRSPLRDLAGMLRSLDYAQHFALRGHASTSTQTRARACRWHSMAREALLQAYTTRLSELHPGLLPSAQATFVKALAAHEAEKAAYEVLYERAHRPSWLKIPLAALVGPEPVSAPRG